MNSGEKFKGLIIKDGKLTDYFKELKNWYLSGVDSELFIPFYIGLRDYYLLPTKTEYSKSRIKLDILYELHYVVSDTWGGHFNMETLADSLITLLNTYEHVHKEEFKFDFNEDLSETIPELVKQIIKEQDD